MPRSRRLTRAALLARPRRGAALCSTWAPYSSVNLAQVDGDPRLGLSLGSLALHRLGLVSVVAQVNPTYCVVKGGSGSSSSSLGEDAVERGRGDPQAAGDGLVRQASPFEGSDVLEVAVTFVGGPSGHVKHHPESQEPSSSLIGCLASASVGCIRRNASPNHRAGARGLGRRIHSRVRRVAAMRKASAHWGTG